MNQTGFPDKAQIEHNRKEIKRHHTILNGRDGHPEEGLIMQTKENTEVVNSIKKLKWAIYIGAIAVIIDTLASHISFTF